MSPDPLQRYLITTWSVDTAQQHVIDVTHRDIPVADMDEAGKFQNHVASMVLDADGMLVYWDNRAEKFANVIDDDVVISVYTLPFDRRGVPFSPNFSTTEGVERLYATLTDPAYISTPDEYMPASITLKELAVIPGATGALGSLAYGISGPAA